MNQIEFGTYIQKSLPSDFLRPIPQRTNQAIDSSFDPEGDIQHYEHYFGYHIEAEIQSQQQQNETHALYAHDGIMIELGVVSFQVPGLQENSPYVEVDEVIHLRQLQEEQLPPSGPQVLGTQQSRTIFRWTNVAYNARVASVQRKNERLIVRISGPPLQAPYVRSTKPTPATQGNLLKFNFQFPIPRERFISMLQVLPVIQQALQYTRENEVLAAPSGQLTGSSWTPDSPPTHRWIQSMLFPTEANCKEQTNLNRGFSSRQFFDNHLNREQQKAIEGVCEQNYGTLPFLISGPPGTGKTKTLVELVVQLIKNVGSISHVIFCAPSDPAADTLIQRLAPHFGPSRMFRLNRTSRAFAEVPDAVLPFCYVSDNTLSLPPFKQLMSYNIVVTTCRDACLLMYARITNSDLYTAEHGFINALHPNENEPTCAKLHWTALIIDEAAQAMEPEALIPFSVVAPPLEHVTLDFAPLLVMAGDEFQLGPRLSLRSSPLKYSLFARLFKRAVYANHPLARAAKGKAPPVLNKGMLPILRPAFANLIRNYRSHPAILAVPSSVFYNDTLLAEASDTDRLASWSGWRGNKWPVLFHNNDSPDDMDGDGGGWYNKREAQLACSYAAQLVRSGLVAPKEVCIMSPFKAQVQLLRKFMRGKGYGGVLWDVDIGPTEIFQGLERGVVIICTTRSRKRLVEKDKELGWGLIDMPNKMNVALTRAKFGLIIIGRKELLVEDPNWKAVLDFCDRNGLVAGEVDSTALSLLSQNIERTVLEKGLLAKEEDLNGSRSARTLGSRSQNEELWTTGMEEPPSVAADNYGELDEGVYSEDSPGW